MPSNLKRTTEEILTLYELEPSIKDIYVEGSTDKIIIELFAEFNNLNCNIYEVDKSIDVSSLDDGSLDLSSHRNKLIAFSYFLDNNLKSDNIICIIDKDFDDLLEQKSENAFLFRTDFSCIESYIINDSIMKKFMRIGFTNFPVEPDEVVREIMKVLKPVYFLRYIKILNNNLKYTVLPPNENIFTSNKAGIITFDLTKYINTFCQRNRIINEVKSVTDELYKLIRDYKGDIRNCMHGHDFVEVFFKYVNSVKNTSNFRYENFEKALFMSMEIHSLEKYDLFKGISSRFKHDEH